MLLRSIDSDERPGPAMAAGLVVWVDPGVDQSLGPGHHGVHLETVEQAGQTGGGPRSMNRSTAARISAGTGSPM